MLISLSLLWMLQNCSDKEAPHLKPSNHFLARTDKEQVINLKKELIRQNLHVHKCKAAARFQPWSSLGAADAVKGSGTTDFGFLPRRKASPERHAGRQVLQVSWIEELGHVEAQFVAGFQKHVHIVLQIQMTQADEAALGSEDYWHPVSECDWQKVWW